MFDRFAPTVYRKRLIVAVLAMALMILSVLIGRGDAPEPADPPEPAPGLPQPAEAPWSTPGSAAFRRGDFAEAARLLKDEFEADPNITAPGILWARAEMRLGNLRQAEAAARAVLVRAEGQADAVLLLGQSLEAQGRWADALPHLQEAIQGRSRPRNRTGVGRCLYYLGQHGEAYAAFKQAAADFPADPLNHYYMGRIDIERGYGARGESHMNRARQFGAAETDAVLWLARAAALQQRFVGSIQIMPMGGWIGANQPDGRPAPPEPGALGDSGVVLKLNSPDTGRMHVAPPDSAAFYAQTWLAAHGETATPQEHGEALLILARSLMLAGDAALARQTLAGCPPEALRSSRGILLTVDVAIELGELTEARRATAQALGDEAIAPETASALYYRAALAHLERAQRAEAGEAANAMLTLDDRSAPALRLMGRLVLADSRPADARAAFQRLIDAHPDAPDAEAIRATLRRLEQENRP